MRVIFDTSILVAAVHSNRGASFALVQSIPSAQFEICLSVPLYVEWQGVLTRAEHLPPGRTAADALAFLRYLCGQAHHQAVYYRLRPFLQDPGDDMIVELAFAADCDYIVTHNLRHFAGCEAFGVVPITPGDFMRILKGAP